MDARNEPASGTLVVSWFIYDSVSINFLLVIHDRYLLIWLILHSKVLYMVVDQET